MLCIVLRKGRRSCVDKERERGRHGGQIVDELRVQHVCVCRYAGMSTRKTNEVGRSVGGLVFMHMCVCVCKLVLL